MVCMTWTTAKDWAAGLDVNGVTGWRLPTVAPVNGNNFDNNFRNNATTDRGYADVDGWIDGSGEPVSEMGHMYYVTLGNLGLCHPGNPVGCAEQFGWGLNNTADFINVRSGYYWTDTESNANTAYDCYMLSGRQDRLQKNSLVHAWAVHDGDVGSPVPLPAAAWLFASALGIFAYLGKRRNNA